MILQTYTIPEDCPARVSHDNNEYHASDNLFNKAKSLSDSGEILITHEFSFEDIPEGIPLDDPLYENLTMRDKETSDIDTDEVVKTVQHIIKKELESIHNKTIASDLTEKFNHTIDRPKELIQANNETNKHSNETKTEHNDFMGPTNGFNISVVHKHSDDNRNAVIKESEVIFDDKAQTALESRLDGTPADDNAIKPNKHDIRIREDHLNDDKRESDNPSLANFHVIDSETDLEVPSGLEGPIPVMVPPPKNFVLPTETLNPEVPRTYYGRYYIPTRSARTIPFSRNFAQIRP